MPKDAAALSQGALHAAMQAYQDQDTDYMDSRRNSASTTDRQQSLEVPVTPAAAPMRKDVQQQRSQQQRPVEAHQELQHLWHHNPMIETDLVDFWDCVVPGSGGHPASIASAALSYHELA